jgi:hypothetical protein
LFPRARIICEEEDDQIDESIAPSLQPDQVLRLNKRQGLFTPEILSISAKGRREKYSRYLNDLLEVNPEAFS